MVFDLDMIQALYSKMPSRIAKAGNCKKTTYTIRKNSLFAHLDTNQKVKISEGVSHMWTLLRIV